MIKAAAVLFASAFAVGVAAAGPDPSAPTPLRLLVKLAHPMAEPTSEESSEIARRATEVAGLPVVYSAAVSADRLALQLSCAPAECDSAVQRLRDATGLFASVERDERRRRHAP